MAKCEARNGVVVGGAGCAGTQTQSVEIGGERKCCVGVWEIELAEIGGPSPRQQLDGDPLPRRRRLGGDPSDDAVVFVTNSVRPIDQSPSEFVVIVELSTLNGLPSGGQASMRFEKMPP